MACTRVILRTVNQSQSKLLVMILHTFNNRLEERTATEPTIINVDVTLEDVIRHTKEIEGVPYHIPQLNKRVIDGDVYQLD